MPTTFWRKRELPPPKNTLQFKRFEDIREVLIEAKADVILADWSHIKRQVGAFVFGKAKECPDRKSPYFLNWGKQPTLIRMEILTAIENAFPSLQICELAWATDTLCRLKLEHRARNSASVNTRRDAERAEMAIQLDAAIRVSGDINISRDDFIASIPIAHLAPPGKFLRQEPNPLTQWIESGYPTSQEFANNTITDSDVEEASTWAVEDSQRSISVSQPSFPSEPSEDSISVVSVASQAVPLSTRAPMAPVSPNPRKRPLKASQKQQYEADGQAQRQKQRDNEARAKRHKIAMLKRAQSATRSLSERAAQDKHGDISDGENTHIAAEVQKKRAAMRQKDGQPVEARDANGNTVLVWL